MTAVHQLRLTWGLDFHPHAHRKTFRNPPQNIHILRTPKSSLPAPITLYASFRQMHIFAVCRVYRMHR